jgi:hypothetical protein
MTTSPIPEEVRRVWHEISGEVGHDPKQLREYYAQIQKSVRTRTINLADQGPCGRTKIRTEVDDQPRGNILKQQNLPSLD